jgi:hypothetical protein
VKFRHFFPIALLCGALAGVIHARAQMWQSWTHGSVGGGAPPSPTSIAFQNYGGVIGTGTASPTVSGNYTTKTNVNTALIGLLAYNGNSVAATTFSYGAISGVDISGLVVSGGGPDLQVFFVPVGSSAVGTHLLTATAGSSNPSVTLYVLEYSGVAQTSAVEGVVSTATFAASLSVNLTTAVANDWGIAVTIPVSGGPTSNNAGWVLRDTDTAQGSDSNAGIPTGTVGLTVSWPTSGWSAVAAFGLKHG